MRDSTGEVGTHRAVGLQDLEGLAGEWLREAGGYRVWVFRGALGAGKTTLIKAMCKSLGYEGATSPSFTIVNEYPAGAQRIVHMDFYRLEKEDEAVDVGTAEYFDSGDYCFVEWPEKIPHLLPDKYVDVKITVERTNLRTLAAVFHDGKEETRI